MQAAIRRGLSVLARSIVFAWCLGVAITGHGSMRVAAAVMLLAIAADATFSIWENVRPRVKGRRARESDLDPSPCAHALTSTSDINDGEQQQR
ncbi:hypothetical protein [Streptomyces sp. NPDC058228]|uniref:hypothetical protein n=1 Tax=unclassified Streptomyces TaxID=2593676 RepID=UPI0036E0ACA1